MFFFKVVGVFYGYWMSYYTKKSYVWVEEYDTRHAPDRRTRRMAEAENKKFRDKAKKERNEEVRVSLTAPFVAILHFGRSWPRFQKWMSKHRFFGCPSFHEKLQKIQIIIINNVLTYLDSSMISILSNVIVI